MRYTLLLFILLFSACASINNDARAPYNSTAAKNISSYALSLLGTPYKYGGHSPKTGFDCSGFVDYVFQYSANVALPHNAQQISRHGSPVKSSQLREGDLVFYETNNQAFSHVGIYLGKDRFIHAPSSSGSVRTENMLEPYWKTHYNGARRIVIDG